MRFAIFITLFPILFILHDFEEIIFFKPWLKKNKSELSQRFPKIAKLLLPRFEKLSIPAFSLAVFEEFILLVFVTYSSLYWERYEFWLALFLGFFIHIIAHMLQGIIMRRYIPALISSILLFPCCLFILHNFLNIHPYSWTKTLFLAFLGIIVVVINLFLAHFFAAKFDSWLKYKYDYNS